MDNPDEDVDLSMGTLEGFSAKETTKLAMIAAFGKSNARSKPVKKLVASLSESAKNYASVVLKSDSPARRVVAKKVGAHAIAKKAVKTTSARTDLSLRMQADVKRLKKWGSKVG